MHPSTLYRMSALLFLASALMALFAACGCAQRTATRSTLDKEYEAAVQITILCGNGAGGYGSGVIVSDHEVLTAGHVAEACGDSDGAWVAETLGGTSVILTPEVGFAGADVARMVAVMGSFQAPRPHVGPAPELGETVCWTAAYPRRDRHCGAVQFDGDGMIRFDYPVEHGNSGSRLYDDQGRLVGIVVQLYLAENGQIVGGRATSLEGKRWLVP